MRVTEVDKARLDDYFLLLGKLLPNSSDEKWMRVTSVSFDEDTGNYYTNWSQVEKPDGNTTIAQLTDTKLPTELFPTIEGEDSILFIEVGVPHDPVVSTLGFTNLEWTPRQVVRPRFTAKVVCNDCDELPAEGDPGEEPPVPGDPGEEPPLPDDS